MNLTLHHPDPGEADPLPDALTPDFVLGLLDDPPRAGALGSAARSKAFGDEVLVRAVAPDGGDVARSIAVQDNAQYVRTLFSLAGETNIVVAPFTAEPEGTRRLWAIAAARLVLAPTARVEAHHHRLGIRLAQVALGFGADTLAGPVEADRSLPMAGVTRPNETTRAGLCQLVSQVGLRPRWHEELP